MRALQMPELGALIVRPLHNQLGPQEGIMTAGVVGIELGTDQEVNTSWGQSQSRLLVHH